MIKVWVGNWGEYPIPAEFASVRITKSGYPDRRFVKGVAMIEYFKRIDRPAQ